LVERKEIEGVVTGRRGIEKREIDKKINK